MTNTQLWTLIVGYFASQAILISVLVLYINAKIGGLEVKIDAVREAMGNNAEVVKQGFAAVNQRFDDMRQLWLAELHRVEGVFDARLKSLED